MFQDFIELQKIRDMLNSYLECPICWEKRLKEMKDDETAKPEVEIEVISEENTDNEKDENSNPEEEKDEFPSEIKDLIKMIRGGK